METLRQTGIKVISSVPWGSHFCQFYETKKDLTDVLVPYFKAGLESNEFCIWVTAHTLNPKEAREAMSQAIPNFDLYIDQGQMEIIPHSEWYLKYGVFNAERVSAEWSSKLNLAIGRGFDGLRVSGDMFWPEHKDWRNVVLYESVANSVIRRHKMIAICTYPLNGFEPFELMDVVSNHPFILVRRAGKWELIENSTQNAVTNLKKRGLSHAEIGRRLDLSRQRVSRILKRKRRLSERPSHSNPNVLLTVGEAAKRLGIHANTLRCWSDKGIVRSYRMGPRQDRRFESRDIDNFISSTQETRT